jgi:hypothetical protein
MDFPGHSSDLLLKKEVRRALGQLKRRGCGYLDRKGIRFRLGHDGTLGGLDCFFRRKGNTRRRSIPVAPVIDANRNPFSRTSSRTAFHNREFFTRIEDFYLIGFLTFFTGPQSEQTTFLLWTIHFPNRNDGRFRIR